ncbi:DUF29 domain-containing protein [Acidisphaera rubrifaciens]|uniref:DUF29 domain-containing protein n=1 Tax=Acidisphaera rubrifaciens HS-AP3 TaxID=1231350 RepID=A0A0D6P511_9PROT|nr:DUF29 domain-containing protein [Acidisphaera rubrifaciens]GAN75979.1 hypothetical protein Asru_0036_09 [Acidisphaera rubrifaciens HS-AP3]
MPDDLYTADILLWSDRQADLLRRLARGERVNDAIDWANVIEEVESVGRSELRTVESLLTRAMEHLLKLHGWPDGPAAKWRQEAFVFLIDARKAFAPSMRQAIDLHFLYQDARAVVTRMTYRRLPPRPAPERCPYTLDDLIVPRPGVADIDALLAHLAPGA